MNEILILDVYHKAVKEAEAQLIEKYNLSKKDNNIDLLFEKEYNCKIITPPNDPFMLSGKVVFANDQYKTLFLLKFQ